MTRRGTCRYIKFQKPKPPDEGKICFYEEIKRSLWSELYVQAIQEKAGRQKRVYPS
jgi:hypothetical protein